MQDCEFRLPSKTIKELRTLDNNKNDHFEVFNEVQNGELNYFQVIDNRSYVTI
jgi:hypothetical protein